MTESSVLSDTTLTVRRVARGLAVLIGLALVAWSVIDPRFREGAYLNGAFAFAIALSAAAMLLGLAADRAWRRAALWGALALIGHAASLQLIEAGWVVRYQHYRTPESLVRDVPAYLAIVGLQAVLVVAGLFVARRSIVEALRRYGAWWRYFGIAMVVLVPAATVSDDVIRYGAEWVFAAFVQLIALGNLVLVVRAVPEEAVSRVEAWGRRLAEPQTRRGPDRIALWTAVWVFAAGVFLALVVYQAHPHVPDEIIYLLHARFFAEGALTLPAPPVPEAFELYLMQVTDGQWFPVPPPGWPLVLAIGVFVGAAWIVNPVLAAVNVLLTFRVLRALYSVRVARIGVLLLGASPWFVFMGMNFMTHMFTLTCALVAILGVIRARETGRAWWAWVGGAALGMLALIRPLEALIMAAVTGLWAIGVGGRRLRWFGVAGLVLGAMLVGALTLPYNKVLSGDATVFPIMQYLDAYYHPNANALGFGPDRGMGWGFDPYPGHNLRDAAINANLNTFMLNVELFGWSVGSLLFLAVLLFSGRMRRSDYLMVAIVTGVFVAHIFYYFGGGPDFGARYWYLMIVPLVVLTVRGIGEAGERLGHGRLLVAAGVLCAMALINFFPWRTADKYDGFRGMRPEAAAFVERFDPGRSLVLIRGDYYPDYAGAAVYNPLDWNADAPVFAWVRNEDVTARVMAAFADRPVLLVDGPSRTGGTYRIADTLRTMPAAE